MKYSIAALIIMITFPLVAQAKVQINEIAWMGTGGTNGQYGEWFELYNDSTETVNLSGWTLAKAGGEKLVYTFTGSIGPLGYYVVERVTTSVPDPVPTSNDESAPFGNGGFANTGEYLVLKNSKGEILQSLNYLSGWPAGDASTKETMQYNGNTWVTAIATPGAKNSIQNAPQGKEVTAATNTTNGFALPREKPTKTTYEPDIIFTIPDELYTGTPYEFSAQIQLEDSKTEHGWFVWNLGDGTVIQSNGNAAVRHMYAHEGEYSVVLSYYQNQSNKTPVLWKAHVVTVFAPRLTLTVLTEKTIRLINNSEKAIDLSHWIVTGSHGSAVIPEKTFVKAGGSIALTMESIGSVHNAVLSTANGVVQARAGVSQIGVVKGYNTSTVRENTVEAIVVTETVEGVNTPTAPQSVKKNNHTNKIVIGVIILAILGAIVLLERSRLGESD